MGYGKTGQGYGQLKSDGSYGWGDITGLNFVPGSINNYNQGGTAIYGSGGQSTGFGPTLKKASKLVFGGSEGGPNGSTNKTNGAGGLMLGAFDMWNNNKQANKMYDLQKDALDFSQDSFWNDFLMKRGIANRQMNQRNAYYEGQKARADNINMSDDEQRQGIANRGIKYSGTDAIVKPDGSGTYNMAQVPDQYTPQATPAPITASANQYTDYNPYMAVADTTGVPTNTAGNSNFVQQNNQAGVPISAEAQTPGEGQRIASTPESTKQKRIKNPTQKPIR